VWTQIKPRNRVSIGGNGGEGGIRTQMPFDLQNVRTTPINYPGHLFQNPRESFRILLAKSLTVFGVLF